MLPRVRNRTMRPRAYMTHCNSTMTMGDVIDTNGTHRLTARELRQINRCRYKWECRWNFSMKCEIDNVSHSVVVNTKFHIWRWIFISWQRALNLRRKYENEFTIYYICHARKQWTLICIVFARTMSEFNGIRMILAWYYRYANSRATLKVGSDISGIE